MNLQSVLARLNRLEADRRPAGFALVIQQVVQANGRATPTDDEVAAQMAAHDASRGPVLHLRIKGVTPETRA